jgi:hypothetical protein
MRDCLPVQLQSVAVESPCFPKFLGVAGKIILPSSGSLEKD